MKKSIYIENIAREHIQVNDYFIVTRKGVFSTKDNRKYMSLGLRDRTGTIEGKVWDRVDELQGLFDKDDIVYLSSRSVAYQGKLQLKIGDIRRLEEEIPLDAMKAFLPQGERDNRLLQDEYFGLVREIRNPHLGILFSRLNEDKGLLERFFSFPASVGVHHVYFGGLLEHSVAVTKMAKEATATVGGDIDIVAAGSLLHDIGKTDEMHLKAGFKYSDKGRLLGHITLGIIRLEELIRSIDGFPPKLDDILKHIIISHHGVEEWGSPRKPMCIEALIVHYLDNLDAKVTGVREHMRDNMEDETWTAWHRLYESRFYKLPGG
ncbi:3'-5' exoribonuclease YhaM family protein [Syntrophorhabdus aromaticivorans]|uniref:HD domain-containing protein n=1 Tax=Syntrophorhabdus aromaticivorans TaxID=328301 RepID=A0A351U700_9BACT|nr:HD domain-containing protein [Syntrophorhabdus aromaticivorans]NLW35407.1 HD domain-containing protein [Syntrophorhabdus aromaticivorans]HBA55731.1 HDIG domain-containing protein [Syntrophorhabdus aromaticivorans]